MINLLWLFLILAVNLGLLWAAYKFFGKTGLFVFGAFAVIQANFQAGLGQIAVGTIGVFASAATWVTLLLAIVLLVQKYGAKSLLTFTIIVGATMAAVLATDLFAMFAIGMEITFLDIFTSSLCTLLLFGIECLVAVVVNELFNGVKIHEYLKLAIILAVLVLVDVILFTGVQSINIMTGEQMLEFGVANLWQKAVVFALMLPMLWLLLKTNVKDLEPILDAKINEQPTEKAEEPKEELAEEKVEAKEVEIIVEEEKAEEKPKTRKTTAKKTQAKKPAAKKETKPAAEKEATAKKTQAKKTTTAAKKPSTTKKATTAKKTTTTKTTKAKTTAPKTTAKKATTKKTTKESK